MNTRYYSDRQEEHVGKVVNAHRTINSGAGNFQKGDLHSSDTLYECKTSVTDKTSFSVKKSVIDKARQEAFANNKLHSVLVFNFGPGSENYYVLSERHYKELIENKI